MESGREETHPVPRRPQHPRRPDQDKRLQAVRPGDDQDHQPQGRQVLRDLPALYQAVSGTEEDQNIYKQFSPDFFDLIVVDECHRGSAAEDSDWRKILEYFTSATQIGLTATPKETKEVSNIDYFGDPIYTYSLRQGIADGFLAPYKVVRIDLDKDLDGWRPERRADWTRTASSSRTAIYNQKDFDRKLVLDKRTSSSPKKSPSSSRPPTASPRPSCSARTSTTPSGCVRPWSTRTPTWSPKNHKYVMRITGDDDEGKAELDNFINPESPATRSSPRPPS